MDKIGKLIQRVQKTQHGFLDIQKAANEVVDEQPAKDSLRIAKQLFTSEIYQARSLATFIFGRLVSNSKEAIEFLKRSVSQDNDWRVQEILAKAFDRYCADVGYEQALPVIKEWLADSSPNVRRAVTEGLRIWTSRPYFRDHPDIAIKLLSQLRDDDSQYVRRSVGNALRDISRKHKAAVKTELQKWDVSNKPPRSKLRGVKAEFAEANPPSLFKLRRVRPAIHPCSKLQGILAKANKRIEQTYKLASKFLGDA